MSPFSTALLTMVIVLLAVSVAWGFGAEPSLAWMLPLGLLIGLIVTALTRGRP